MTTAMYAKAVSAGWAGALVLVLLASFTLPPEDASDSMDLGAFSISLSVQDISLSKDFYQHLGFEVVGGNIDQNWLILRNGDHVIGLFQGMFEKNMLTFNPGWDQRGEALEKFTDVREIQRRVRGIDATFVTEADESTTGPASFIVLDPDGNPILVDQHVSAP